MKIDIFTHILPAKYKEAFYRAYYSPQLGKAIEAAYGLYDLDTRFKIIDEFECAQVLTLGGVPPVEAVMEHETAVEVARIGNDEMAELVDKYPDRFVAFVASLPLTDMDSALMEIERAVNELHCRGIQLYTSVKGQPLDSPNLFPLYEKMLHYDLPIWIHPGRGIKTPDYTGETVSKYQIWSIFGWPYETTAAMTRLIFGGVLKKFNGIKVITHHAGAMVPFFAGRIVNAYDLTAERFDASLKKDLGTEPVECYREFYCDTALGMNPAGLMCSYEFFGSDHILFGTDMPFGIGQGHSLISQAISTVEQMKIDRREKDKIFEQNARFLLHL